MRKVKIASILLATLALVNAANAEEPTAPEALCKSAIDNMYKVEFAKDAAGAENLKALMEAARAMPDYSDAMEECKAFPFAYAQCLVAAKSEKDVLLCDKKIECESAVKQMMAFPAPEPEPAATGKAAKKKKAAKAPNPVVVRQKKLEACLKMSDAQIKCFQDAQSAEAVRACESQH